MIGHNLNRMSNFHRLEVVGRDSETQLQVGENLNCHNVALTVFTTYYSDALYVPQSIIISMQLIP